MGTRADFYIGPAEKLEWIGSVAWDGYPDGFDDAIMKAGTEGGFKDAVLKEINGRDDGTLPLKGWPWPWNDSDTSDYGYWWNGQEVVFGCDGHWIRVADHSAFWKLRNDDDPKAFKKFSQGALKWPDMSALKNCTLGRRSGLIVIGA